MALILSVDAQRLSSVARKRIQREMKARRHELQKELTSVIHILNKKISDKTDNGYNKLKFLTTDIELLSNEDYRLELGLLLDEAGYRVMSSSEAFVIEW